MSPAGRIALGAMLGAVLTLLLHPLSSGILTLCFRHPGPSQALAASDWLEQNLEILPYPDNLLVASQYMQVGADRLNRGAKLSTANLDTLVQVAEAAAAQDVDNAFWLQMAAVYLRERGDNALAHENWMAASEKLAWNDYQSARLMQVRSAMDREFGRTFAWHNARLTAERSDACANAIERLGSHLTANLGFESTTDLELRFACIRNGKLLRDGSRSIPVGMNGVNMVEFSTYPNRAMIEATPRILLVSRNNFVNALVRQNLDREALEVSRIFYENEGWIAETGKDDPESQNWWRAFWSVFAASAPSALAAASLLGFALWGFGQWGGASEKNEFLLKTPFAPITGIAAATAAYATTGQTLFALTIVLSLSFVAFSPSQTRSQIPSSFGPFFSFLMIVLGATFCILSATFFAGIASPAVECFPFLGVPREYYSGGTVTLGLAGITFCLIFLIAPFYGYALKVPTPVVGFRAIAQFGKVVAILGAVGGVTLAPFAAAMDRQLEPETSMILQNEPNFYVLQ